MGHCSDGRHLEEMTMKNEKRYLSLIGMLMFATFFLVFIIDKLNINGPLVDLR